MPDIDAGGRRLQLGERERYRKMLYSIQVTSPVTEGHWSVMELSGRDVGPSWTVRRAAGLDEDFF